MTEKPARTNAPHPSTDTGLRQVLTWTLVALVLTILMTLAAVTLVVRWFDAGPGS